jgi:cupin 2 domain-containing protein
MCGSGEASQESEEMPGLCNVFAQIPTELPQELCRCLLSTPGFRIERIVSRGHSSPEGFWYDQETDEWVMLLSGAARLALEGREPVDLRPGAFVNISAHQRHRVEWTDPGCPTIWLAIPYAARPVASE